MSRTAHHIVSRRAVDGSGFRPWRALNRWELRYSADETVRAPVKGGRAVPRAVRLRVAVYVRPRWGGQDAVLASFAERRARARLRGEVTRIRGLVNAGLNPEEADGTGLGPYRHRRDALWHA